MLSIGEFSQLSHLSIRTLRRYHDAGLLEPARVDGTSGYRYYTAEQIPAAQVIHRLRESAVSSLRRLLRPDPADLDVELRHVPEMLVAAVEATLDHGELLDWYPGAMALLDAAVPEPAGPPGGSYANTLFTDGRGEALVYLPVTSPPPAASGVRAVTLPAVDVAVTVHPGEHDTIDVTYGQLGSWVVEHALAVAGPVRESYRTGPRDTPDATRWRTEIGWPVFRVATGRGGARAGGRSAGA